MKFRPIILLGSLLFLVACSTNKKSFYTNYLQNMNDTSGHRVVMPEPVIQKGDLLSIRVFSASLTPAVTDAPYNFSEQGTASSTATSAGAGAGTSAGILVDENGDIEYPRIGRLHVADLTKVQLAEVIRKRFERELTSPSVVVRFLNYRVAVLGEVRNPGWFTVPTERVTILEALGLSGDVTDYGNKSRVRVARQKDTAVEVGYVDLTSKDLFQSPYYRLQQNDVVMVEQVRRKSEQVEQQAVAQRIGIITGIVSTLAIIFTLVRR